MSSFIEQLKWQILLDCGVLVVNKSLSAPAILYGKPRGIRFLTSF